ncbi:MAG: pyridoxamine 5'-phosphate oxidase family protein [Deltaproteobacteria bacterium]|nr:pyridoxamine 5'-phosphate oxidase family protein [Deltaproteobacteria bacterium]
MRTTMVLSCVGLLLAVIAAGASALPAEVERALATQKQIWVATSRADGSRSQAAPIWFWWDGTSLYFSTSPTSHKAKRIRKGSPVFVSVEGKDGPFLSGKPEIITDLQLVERLGGEYSNKYWLAWLGLFRPRATRVSAGKTVVVKVALAAPGNG